MTDNKQGEKIMWHIVPSAFHTHNDEQGIAEVVRYESIGYYATEDEAINALPAHNDCVCGGYRVVPQEG